MEQLLQLALGAIAVGCVYAVIALSLELAYEATGVVNFATGQLAIVGSLIGVTALGLSGESHSATYLMTLAGMMAVGVLFFCAGYWPLRGQPLISIIIGTMAIGMFIQNISLMAWGSLPLASSSPVGRGVSTIFGASMPHHAIFVVLVTACLVLSVYLLLYKSMYGTKLRALAQDSDTAQLMGINTNRSLLGMWVLVCVLGGIAGLLLAPMWFVDVTMGDALALKAFAAAVIGGFGSIPGAICGGILVGLTEILGSAYISSQYQDAIVFGLMILFLIFRPQGLFGERISDRA